MVRTWNTLLALLWPHDETPLTRRSTASVCLYKNTHCLFSYKEPHIQTLVKRTKYQADRVAAKQLAAYLDIYLERLTHEYVIIPMPISYKRWRTRGYNHIELICTYSAFVNHMRTNILKKSQHTEQQTRVSKTKRIQQQRGTFKCDKAHCHALPQMIILLDDVVTTGATMTAAQAALQSCIQPGTKLISLAIAH